MAEIKSIYGNPIAGGNTSGLIYKFTHEDGKSLFNHLPGATYNITDNEEYGAKVETFKNLGLKKFQIFDLPIKDKTPNKIIIDLKFNKDSTYISRPQLFIGNITSDFLSSLINNTGLASNWDYDAWIEYICPNSIFNMGVISEAGTLYYNNSTQNNINQETSYDTSLSDISSSSSLLNTWLRLVFNNINTTTHKFDLSIYDLSLNKPQINWIGLEFWNDVDINCIACGLNNNELLFGDIELYY